MFRLSDNSPKNNTVSHFSFSGGNLTNHAGLILFKELFHQLHLKELISKVLVTNDKRHHYQYSDADIVLQFLYHLLAGYDTDSACQELKFDAYFPKLLENGQVASQPTLSRFLSRSTERTVDSLRHINLELVKLFLRYQGHQNLIVDVDSTHFSTYGKQEGTSYNAHYRETGYHPLYAFEGQLGYCLQASLRPGNVYCSEQAEDFIKPILENFENLLFRMDSGFATPKLYDVIEDSRQHYLIKLKNNTVLSRLGDLSHPNLEDEEVTILPRTSYSEDVYQAGSWRCSRRVCQFSHRKEGELLYDVISLVTNMTGGSSEEYFQLYRQRGQAENFIKEMKAGFFGDKTDSSTMLKNEVRMMLSCIAYNLFLFLKHLVGGDIKRLTIKRFRQLFVSIAGKCVRTARKQILKLSQLYAYQEQFRSLFHCISNLSLRLPVVVQAGRQ